MVEENLLIEILRPSQADRADLKESRGEIQHRLTLFEQRQARSYAWYAGQSGRLGRIDARLERIERRLKLREVQRRRMKDR